MLESVIFDFDGVILESADVKTDAFCALYAEHGPDVVARVREHHLANLGISRFQKFAWIAKNILVKTLADGESEALGERFSALALERVLAAPFVTGAENALKSLALPCFIASGTPEDELRLIVDRRGIAAHFREVHGSPREKPAIIEDLIDRYHLRRQHVLFVGDGMSDYKAACAVGVPFLARDTPALRPQWESLGVRRVDNLETLPAVVAGW